MQIRQKEGERVLARLEKCRQSSSYVMALAIDGRELDSVELSQKLEKLGTDGISHVIFLIGGSLGMSKELLAAADFKLSFSRMTFPHQLMRVILLEQIYRGPDLRRSDGWRCRLCRSHLQSARAARKK